MMKAHRPAPHQMAHAQPEYAGAEIGHRAREQANTVKTRTHSLFRQGLMLYQPIPNWPEHRLRPLVEKFAQMLSEQRVYREIFGVI